MGLFYLYWVWLPKPTYREASDFKNKNGITHFEFLSLSFMRFHIMSIPYYFMTSSSIRI